MSFETDGSVPALRALNYALKKLEGRIISFHFKDLNEMGPLAHDMPWGQGKADVKALLKEIKRQGIKAVFSIEYEYNWDKNNENYDRIYRVQRKHENTFLLNRAMKFPLIPGV
jgi:sugar phosphate isomerase/epimerase